MDNRSKAEELANRPYLMITSLDSTTDENQIYFARLFEIEGCFGQGTTQEAAIEDLRLALVDYIESLLEDGMPVPEPIQSSTEMITSSTQATYTFIAQGHSAQPKQDISHKDISVLLAQSG
jgi:predicted RNase H-like HicB family nuclease